LVISSFIRDSGPLGSSTGRSEFPIFHHVVHLDLDMI
jgi:hypothetical protein